VSPEFIGKWLIKKGFDLKKRMHYLFGNETALPGHSAPTLPASPVNRDA
jgi:hypothetical protein